MSQLWVDNRHAKRLFALVKCCGYHPVGHCCWHLSVSDGYITGTWRDILPGRLDDRFRDIVWWSKRRR